MKKSFFSLAASAILGVATLTVAYAGPTAKVEAPGGKNGTVNDLSPSAFMNPFDDLDIGMRREFFVGRSFFHASWVIAPASAGLRDGLGPTFNATACASCHIRDGRGEAYLADGSVDVSLLFRLSQRDHTPHPVYGDQLQPFGVPGVEGEGRVEVEWIYTEGQYPDGDRFQLRTPKFKFLDLAHGDFEQGVRISPRVAPHMAGMGLLEAIDQKDILALEDPQDVDGDGISGRANRVLDVATGRLAVGRFGWKSNQPSLRQQNAGAFLGDLGITSSLFPNSNCPPVQIKCAKAPSGGNPELDDLSLDRITLYTQLLAVPQARPLDPEIRENGRAKFNEVGCASCHTPSFKTGDHPVKPLAHQLIFPYTDLLLHDLGPALADHRHDGQAGGREWRTQPLWSVGLFPTVNGHQNLLHDGRARGVEEAILWHDGEAAATRIRFMGLDRKDRKALIRFVESL